jgi:hypothetical protein
VVLPSYDRGFIAFDLQVELADVAPAVDPSRMACDESFGTLLLDLS